MKVVGIVGRPYIGSDNENIIGIQEAYRRAFAEYEDVLVIGMEPFKDINYNETLYSSEEEMNDIEKNKIVKFLELCDGIVMPGGCKWYRYDEFITEYMIEHDKPLLGICLGMQIMNIVDHKMNNMEMKNELNDTVINHFNPENNYVHRVEIDKSSLLFDILKRDNIMVNSRHNYHIPSTLNFKVSAVSEDGLIEAIEYPNKKFVVGVQWHPENMKCYDDIQKNIFDRFIEKL